MISHLEFCFAMGGTLCLLGDLVTFKKRCEHQIPASCECRKYCCIVVEMLKDTRRTLCMDSQVNVRSTFIHIVEKTGNVSAIWPDSLKKKCALVKVVDTLYAIPLPNRYERD